MPVFIGVNIAGVTVMVGEEFVFVRNMASVQVLMLPRLSEVCKSLEGLSVVRLLVATVTSELSKIRNTELFAADVVDKADSRTGILSGKAVSWRFPHNMGVMDEVVISPTVSSVQVKHVEVLGKARLIGSVPMNKEGYSEEGSREGYSVEESAVT